MTHYVLITLPELCMFTHQHHVSSLCVH